MIAINAFVFRQTIALNIQYTVLTLLEQIHAQGIKHKVLALAFLIQEALQEPRHSLKPPCRRNPV